MHVSVAGERGTIQLFTVLLDYPLGGSGIRQGQVRQLVEFVAETAPRRDLVVVCGDFNAGPDSDEIRMLTGRSAPGVPGTGRRLTTLARRRSGGGPAARPA